MLALGALLVIDERNDREIMRDNVDIKPSNLPISLRLPSLERT